MKTFTGFASAIVVALALALVGCGGGSGGDLGSNGGGDQVAKPSFALPSVISAVPPQQ